MRPDRPAGRLVLLALLVASVGCSDLLGGRAELATAERAAGRWAARHPTGAAWSMQTGRPLARPAWSPPCSAAPESGTVTVSHIDRGTELHLAFRCPIAEPLGPVELQDAFAYAVLDRLPHGISVPGWRFRLLTPTSSVSDGVTFAPGPGGRVEIRIEAPLHAITGRSTAPRCEPPADAPMPEGCYLSRPHAIPLSVVLTAPIDAGTLR
jgi:hypothetical protein